MVDLDRYIEEIKKELDQAAVDLYRLQGALAMLQKMKAEAEQAKPPEKE